MDRQMSTTQIQEYNAQLMNPWGQCLFRSSFPCATEVYHIDLVELPRQIPGKLTLKDIDNCIQELPVVCQFPGIQQNLNLETAIKSCTNECLRPRSLLLLIPQAPRSLQFCSGWATPADTQKIDTERYQYFYSRSACCVLFTLIDRQISTTSIQQSNAALMHAWGQCLCCSSFHRAPEVYHFHLVEQPRQVPGKMTLKDINDFTQELPVVCQLHW